ncbi:MAG: Holliday junction branch migration protein RuvA [Pseudomonadota bacterium]|jgi:Holliday junction DNA helicase RuvA|nr:Holliday junction branch migration protein RuvA [Pseudomonadota bacterium]|tara:strand:- start:981 stop:1586 length:606 start_codon:yes stop_codon:yes gene_type:complete
MIGKLTGRLDAVSDNGAIIDVGGVGYSVFTSSRTMSQLGSIGEVVTVLVETHVREDHIHLYAFYSDDEKRWFQTLQTVQGVGSKAALAILSALTSEDIMNSLLSEDKTMFVRADGVGQKLATRIVSELKDKVDGFFAGNVNNIETTTSPDNSLIADAISAMVNLGFSRFEAQKAVSKASNYKANIETLDKLIAATLKELAS